jgi:hypothetical protein
MDENYIKIKIRRRCKKGRIQPLVLPFHDLTMNHMSLVYFPNLASPVEFELIGRW